jgi:hypothetical protein
MAPKKRPAKHAEDVEPKNGNDEGNGNGNGDDEPVADAASFKPPIKPKPDDGGDIDIEIRKDKITIVLPRDGDAPETLNRLADLLDGLQGM